MSALLSTSELCQRLGISRNTLWRMEKLGQIPAPIRIGSLKRWRESDLNDLIAAGGTEARKAS